LVEEGGEEIGGVLVEEGEVLEVEGEDRGDLFRIRSSRERLLNFDKLVHKLYIILVIK